MSKLQVVTDTSMLNILHEDTELLVVCKPAGLVCHPSKSGPLSSLIGRIRLHLGPGAQPQLINRLDRETSGVVLATKSLPAARELRRLFENRSVHKEYLAIVHGHFTPDHELIDAPLGKDDASPIAIKDTIRADGAPAQTEAWVEHRFYRGAQPYSLLRVCPRTGRKHQIRIHLSSKGHPVVGDKLYGSDPLLYLAFVEGRLTEADRERLQLPYHALHAAALRYSWRGLDWDFRAAPEPWFTSFCGRSLPAE
jgi:23S rRNA pseudouridine1911/1915/1917 synthase